MNTEDLQTTILVMFVALLVIGGTAYGIKLIFLARDANRAEELSDLKRIDEESKTSMRRMIIFCALVIAASICVPLFLF